MRSEKAAVVLQMYVGGHLGNIEHRVHDVYVVCQFVYLSHAVAKSRTERRRKQRIGTKKAHNMGDL